MPDFLLRSVDSADSAIKIDIPLKQSITTLFMKVQKIMMFLDSMYFMYAVADVLHNCSSHNSHAAAKSSSACESCIWELDIDIVQSSCHCTSNCTSYNTPRNQRTHDLTDTKSNSVREW